MLRAILFLISLVALALPWGKIVMDSALTAGGAPDDIKQLYEWAAKPQFWAILYVIGFASLAAGAFWGQLVRKWRRITGWVPDKIAEGDLVRGRSKRIFVVEAGKRRWIPDEPTLAARGWDFFGVIRITDEELFSIGEGNPIASVLGPPEADTGTNTDSEDIVDPPRVVLVPATRGHDGGFEVWNHTRQDLERVQVRITSLEMPSQTPGDDRFFTYPTEFFQPCILEWHATDRIPGDQSGGVEIRIPPGEPRFITVGTAEGIIPYIACANPGVRDQIQFASNWANRFELRLSASGLKSPIVVVGYVLEYEWSNGQQVYYARITPDEEFEVSL